MYVVSSLTKAATAAMVGILADEGKLSWTYTVARRYTHIPPGEI